jgi:transcriptional regulator GlxA family with amidase domain
MTRVVEILAFPAAQLLDVCGPLQVFASANDLATEAGEPRPYAAEVVAEGGVAVVTSAGLGLATNPLSPVDAALDTLILPGGAGTDAACGNAIVMAWVAARARRARRVASVCTGAFLLAEAGLLDGRRAVTHWAHCGDLAARYPMVTVEADPIFIRDGAIWTSAGVTAGIDLALTLVEHDLGRATALAVARQLVVFLKRPGGQSQFSATLSAQRAAGRFEALHDWLSRHLATDLSVAALARQAGMSERGFARHYRAETGLTPAQAVERFRVEAARLLLADTSVPIKRIAAQCGFGSEDRMRRSFLRLIATTPGDYRRRFSVGA